MNENHKVTPAAAVMRHPWQNPSALWKRIHIDYGEWNSRHFLVVVYTFSKWPEVKLVPTTTSQMTTNKLRWSKVVHLSTNPFSSYSDMWSLV